MLLIYFVFYVNNKEKKCFQKNLIYAYLCHIKISKYRNLKIITYQNYSSEPH
jgi:hypothetical protein